MFWQVIQGIAFLVVATVPFLGGARATVDPDDLARSGHQPRTSRARTRRRAPWRRSGTAGAGASPEPPAPAPYPGARGRVLPRSAARAGLHWTVRP